MALGLVRLDTSPSWAVTISTHAAEADQDPVTVAAQRAAGIGDVINVVRTAGVSPVQASPRTILAVDLVGVALVLEEFRQVVAQKAVQASSSLRWPVTCFPLSTLKPTMPWRSAPWTSCSICPRLSAERVSDSGFAYVLAKRANQLGVQAEAVLWGDRGARINAISPGIILTPLARDELAGRTCPAGPS